MPRGEIELRRFGAETAGDAVSVLNRYIEGWPFSREIDAELLDYWKTCGDAYQPDNMLIAYREGVPQAFLHGEVHLTQFRVHILAAIAGARAEAAALLAEAEAIASDRGLTGLRGPSYRSAAFYAGYVLGREPFHPDWAVEATEAYSEAGFEISHPGVILVLGSHRPGTQPEPPVGFEVLEVPAELEFGAVTFGCQAFLGGEQVAHCYARLYPRLTGAAGRPVGQIGHVGTVEAHRGRGLAGALVRQCVRRLREAGAGDILVATGTSNYPALRAYEKAGFDRRHTINEWSKAWG